MVRWTEFHHCIWAIAMILVNDPFDQSCIAQTSSTSFICSRVILYFWLCLSELTTPSMQKFLIIGLLGSCSVFSEFSLPRIFWSILGELLCIQHIRNSTADPLSRTTSCHAGFYIKDFSTTDFYGFHQLWFTVWLKYYRLSHQVSSLYIVQNGLVLWSSGSVLYK